MATHHARLSRSGAVALATLLIFSLTLLTACTREAAAPAVQTLAGNAMGTTWSVKVSAAPARLPTLQTRIEGELARIIAQMSTWEPDSDLSRFNRAPAESWHALPDDLFHVLTFALDLARDTDGAYDPTVGPLVNLWGFGPDGAPRNTPPDAADIRAAQAHIGWARITLDRTGQRALQPGGVVVDISSLGPGFAVDRIAKVLDDAGTTAYLVELGGEMRARGRKPDGSAWRIAVERPDADLVDAQDFDVVIDLDNAALGSSGDYRSGFEHDGRHYSHTIDPRTGAPVDHTLAAVTVLAPTAMQADASAAALMVLGPERGRVFAEQHQLAAAFTHRTPDGFTRELTPAFAAKRVQ